MRPLHVDVWVGAGIFAFGAFVLLILIPFGVVRPDHIPAKAITPDFWPKITGWMLVVLGAVVTVESFFKPAGRSAMRGADSSADESGPVKAVVRICLSFTFLFVAWGMIPWVGLPVASGLIIFAFGLLFDERRLWLLALIAVLLPLALFYFFSEIANVPIPTGELFE